MVQSKWGQTTIGDYIGGTSCYNYFTPPYTAGNSDNYPTGCVATATAQLMRYHEYPVADVNTPSFTIYVNGSPQIASLRGGDGAGGAYLWSDMMLDPTSGPIDPNEREAIGGPVL